MGVADNLQDVDGYQLVEVIFDDDLPMTGLMLKTKNDSYFALISGEWGDFIGEPFDGISSLDKVGLCRHSCRYTRIKR